MVEELPLYVTMIVRRLDNGTSPYPIGIKSVESKHSGNTSPDNQDIKVWQKK